MEMSASGMHTRLPRRPKAYEGLAATCDVVLRLQYQYRCAAMSRPSLVVWRKLWQSRCTGRAMGQLLQSSGGTDNQMCCDSKPEHLFAECRYVTEAADIILQCRKVQGAFGGLAPCLHLSQTLTCASKCDTQRQKDGAGSAAVRLLQSADHTALSSQTPDIACDVRSACPSLACIQLV